MKPTQLLDRGAANFRPLLAKSTPSQNLPALHGQSQDAFSSGNRGLKNFAANPLRLAGQLVKSVKEWETPEKVCFGTAALGLTGLAVGPSALFTAIGATVVAAPIVGVVVGSVLFAQMISRSNQTPSPWSPQGGGH